MCYTTRVTHARDPNVVVQRYRVPVTIRDISATRYEQLNLPRPLPSLHDIADALPLYRSVESCSMYAMSYYSACDP